MIIYRKQNGFTRKLFSIAEKASDIFVRKEDKNIAKDPITKNRVDKVTVCNQSGAQRATTQIDCGGTTTEINFQKSSTAKWLF